MGAEAATVLAAAANDQLALKNSSKSIEHPPPSDLHHPGTQGQGEHQGCVQHQGGHCPWCHPHHLWPHRPWLRHRWHGERTICFCHWNLDICLLLCVWRTCHWRSTKREQVPSGRHHGDVHHLRRLRGHPAHHVCPCS